MLLNWLDRVGDWNPQFFRELKGRLKARNLAIAAAISVMGQFLLVLLHLGQLPPAISLNVESFSHQYCKGTQRGYGNEYACVRDAVGDFIINWQSWWLDLFVWLSLIGSFTLLVIGTYMLISDLTKEERRDTLNFVRLSPRSTQSILMGKLLGVPVVLYLATALAMPLHLYAGLVAQISFGAILSFYGVLITSCIFFYSAALLYSFVSSWLGGFQVWLGSSLVLGFLLLTTSIIDSDIPANNPVIWLRLLNPAYTIPGLLNSEFLRSSSFQADQWSWFYLPLGAHRVGVVSFTAVNFGLGIYWIWQSLQRCFRNPNATMLSKRQSYWLTACFTVLTLGFAHYPGVTDSGFDYRVTENLVALFFLDFLLSLYLIAALTPQRQALQDWARYRRESASERKRFWNRSLIRDLVWGEKSPSWIAIALNLMIAITPLSAWILLAPIEIDYKINALIGTTLATSLVLIYAAIVQLILLIPAQNRVLLAVGAVGAAIFFPPMALSLVGINPDQTFGFLWLFSAAAPIVPITLGLSQTQPLTLAFCYGILAQWVLISGLNWHLTRQLHRAGESNSKALLSEKRSLPAGSSS